MNQFTVLRRNDRKRAKTSVSSSIAEDYPPDQKTQHDKTNHDRDDPNPDRHSDSARSFERVVILIINIIDDLRSDLHYQLDS